MGVSNYSQELYSNGLINELTDGLVNVYVEAEVVKCIPDLMQYLPEYWQGIKEMEQLQTVIGEREGITRYLVEDLLNQLFVNTATWGLGRWEKELGLETDLSKTYERRRENILAKLRGSGTTTREMIKNMAIAFSGGEVEVIEYPNEHRFDIRFTGVMGIPPNMQGLEQALDEIKPAHLDYSFKYTYTIWNNLSQLSWSEVGNKTWDEIRVFEGV